MASDYRLVVIAASAGGLAAVSAIISALPASFPLPIALVQHRTAELPNLLTHVLERRTKLHVRNAENGDELLPGTLYVAMPGAHLIVDANRRLGLDHGPKSHHVRPAGNELFETAASVFGRGVIGVVLSGGDSDGMEGTRAVKRAGGIVIAQDKETSFIFSMPQHAIGTGDVELVLPMTEISRALESLAESGRYTPAV